MSEPRQLHPDHLEGTGQEGFDHDVDLRVVGWVGVALAAATVVVSLLMWWLVVRFERFDAAREPAAPPLAEARQRVVPRQPRLQTTPERDLREQRAAEMRLLEETAWVDRARGTARIPIETAMDAVVAGVKPVVGQGTGPQPGAAPLAGTAGIGAPVSPQPLADSESRQPPPQTTEEAPPPR